MIFGQKHLKIKYNVIEYVNQVVYDFVLINL
jgi:hypothetical protein